MAIQNKRVAVKQQSQEAKLRSKLNEDFGLTEDDDMGSDDLDLGGGEDDLADDTSGLDDLGGDAGLEGGADAGTEDAFAELNPTQEQQLDSEMDELLNFSLDDLGTPGAVDGLEEDDNLDVESPVADVNTMAGDVGNPMGDEQVTSNLTVDDLESIIASPDSLHALEDELISKITAENGMGMETPELGIEEACDPMKGISSEDQGGFDQGYEGKDVKDELQEDVTLTSELKDLDFEEPKEGLNDKISATVTQKSKSSDRSAEDFEKDVAGVVQESIKKSKMLVKAAAAILKMKKINEAQQKEIAKLKFEQAKLMRVNGIFSAVGDKLSKEVRKGIVEGFGKCNTAKEVNSLYEKVVKAIKESSKPSLNESVKKTKTNVAPKVAINENKEEVKLNVSKSQMRINHLMGLDTDTDMYYVG